MMLLVAIDLIVFVVVMVFVPFQKETTSNSMYRWQIIIWGLAAALALVMFSFDVVAAIHQK